MIFAPLLGELRTLACFFTVAMFRFSGSVASVVGVVSSVGFTSTRLPGSESSVGAEVSSGFLVNWQPLNRVAVRQTANRAASSLVGLF